jgi:Double zinc ribbon domain
VGRNLLGSAVSGAAVLANGVFATLFPSDCRICSVPLINISRLPVCSKCLLAMTPISAATCDICGERVAGNRIGLEDQLCPPCQEIRPEFFKAAAYGNSPFPVGDRVPAEKARIAKAS